MDKIDYLASFMAHKIVEQPPTMHYIAMAGLHGCLPQFCASFETTQAAYSALLDLHDLDFLSSDASDLMADGYVELDLELHGNEYAEIIECDCDDPSVHNDD